MSGCMPACLSTWLHHTFAFTACEYGTVHVGDVSTRIDGRERESDEEREEGRQTPVPRTFK